MSIRKGENGLRLCLNIKMEMSFANTPIISLERRMFNHCSLPLLAIISSPTHNTAYAGNRGQGERVMAPDRGTPPMKDGKGCLSLERCPWWASCRFCYLLIVMQVL